VKIAIIGGGNMAGAIVEGLISSSFNPSDIFISDKDENKLVAFREKGIITGTNKENASVCDVIILAVKPNVYHLVLSEIKDVTRTKLVISIAAGISISYIKNILGKGAKVLRVMPNTPALVGEGMTVLSAEAPLTEDEIKIGVDIFSSFSKVTLMNESLMDTVVGVSGSSPAYVFMLIEAMADAAVLGGIPKQDAILMAAQSVLGSAKMVLETGKHPAELRDMVCSPGGTTIEAVRYLEKAGFRSSIIEAMDKCSLKSKELQK